jgi:hypothetical protein
MKIVATQGREQFLGSFLSFHFLYSVWEMKIGICFELRLLTTAKIVLLSKLL